MFRFLLTAALVAALACCAGIWLDGRLREARRTAEAEFELRVERDLDKLVSLEKIAGSDLKLLDVLRHVARQVNVPVFCNQAKLTGNILLDKNDFDLPETKLSFRNVLGILSHQMPIGYYADQGRLVITTSRDAGDALVTRVYPLPQLAGPEQPFGSDPETWKFVLSVVIKPDSWDEVKGSATVVPVPGALVIRQTRRAHDRLRQFFRRLESDSPAPDAKGDYFTALSPAERQIHTALEVPCDFECTAAPLLEVLQKLSEKHGSHQNPLICRRSRRIFGMDVEPTVPFAGAAHGIERSASIFYAQTFDAARGFAGGGGGAGDGGAGDASPGGRGGDSRQYQVGHLHFSHRRNCPARQL